MQPRDRGYTGTRLQYIGIAESLEVSGHVERDCAKPPNAIPRDPDLNYMSTREITSLLLRSCARVL